MAELKTTYKDDVLNTSKNTKRKFNMITNSDGTVSFEDVTEYSQVGDAFSATDVNAITEEVNALNTNMNKAIKEITALNSSTNFDEITETGIYHVNLWTGSGGSSFPNLSNNDKMGILQVYALASGMNITQMYMSLNGNIRFRGCYDGAWCAWRNLSIRTQDFLLNEYTMNMTAGAVNKFPCDWHKYDELFVGIGTYMNFFNSITVPYAYFVNTNANMRLQLVIEGCLVDVYQGGEGNIIVSPNADSVNYEHFAVTIYGIGARLY